MKKILFLFAIPILLTFCNKEKNGVIMTYQISHCGDAWHNEPNYENDKAEVIRKYIKKQGVTVNSIDVSVVQECVGKGSCYACTCKSCDKATVNVNASDVAAMEKLKFVKE